LVYNNSQLEALISALPKNLDEMKKVPGFGDVKCQKYGKEILDIINKHR
jgi:superfamily II DNA helicase RecQ